LKSFFFNIEKYKKALPWPGDIMLLFTGDFFILLSLTFDPLNTCTGVVGEVWIPLKG